MGLCFDEKARDKLINNNTSSTNDGSKNRSKEELNLKP
jgi:hypothetical protein